MNTKAVERQALEEGLRRAIEREEFALHYQPKIDLKTGKITGTEALLRWTHEKRGLISPIQFSPVAEDSGIILPIGNWVLYEACRQARSWLDAGLPAIKIAVNVSALQFRAENFTGDLFGLLDQFDLNARSIEIELTESVLMRYAETAASTLNALRARGVQIAIDDFGTGYSSLSYLRRFPVDELKIDQSFVRRISAHSGDAPIVNSNSRDGSQPQAAGRRGGCRNTGRVSVSQGSPMRRGARILFQQTGACRGVCDAAQNGHPHARAVRR